MLEGIVCKRCGMAYFPHSAEEKAAHTKYHNYTTSAIRLRVGHRCHSIEQTERKKERNHLVVVVVVVIVTIKNLKHQHVLQQFLDGSIYMIGCTSPSIEQKKAEQVRESIDHELGINTPFNCLWSETKVCHTFTTNIVLIHQII
jgi:hypothetical protein